MHALVSYLDKKSDLKVRSFSKGLEKILGVQVPIPHISYQVAGKYDFVKLERSLQPFARSSRKFRVHAGSLGVFTGLTPTLHIPLVRTPQLSKFHFSLWKRTFHAASDVSPDYRPDRWVPHITLARGMNHRKLANAVGPLSKEELELDIVVDNIAVILYDGGKHSPRSNFQLRK